MVFSICFLCILANIGEERRVSDTYYCYNNDERADTEIEYRSLVAVVF